MNREDFLQELREALNGEMPVPDIEGQIRYYEDYFRSEQQNGKSEQEILVQLGGPRLIARTIIDSYKMAQTPWNNAGNGQEGHYYNEDADYSAREEEPQSGRRQYAFSGKIPWYYKVFGVLILVFLFAAVIMLGGIFLRVGLPILMIWLVVQMIFMGTRR